MMKSFVNAIVVLACLSGILFSCKKKNSLDVDVSQIEIDLKVKRLDVDLFNLNFQDSINSINALQEKYEDFFNLYNYRVIKLGSPDSPDYTHYVRQFIGSDLIREVKLKTDSVFSSFSDQEEQLEEAFKHYAYYFPNRSIPDICTCISGFNQSIVTAEGVIGVSLEKYLGANCEFYHFLAPPVPHYQRANMHPGKIVADCLYAWGVTEFPMDKSNYNLLGRMIHQGKIMYFLDAMMPQEADTIKIGYSQRHLTWCENNHEKMWTFLVENKMIYSTNRIDIRRYIDNSPFTSSFGNESPGRTGVWIGWQIVRSYMKNNTEVSLPELMRNNDYQKILNHSGYNPGQ